MAERQATQDEQVAALLRGDKAAFTVLVDRHNATMLRVARSMLPARGLAEEVVQETWLAILKGLPRFEGRSSLKTWMFRILTNRAKTRARREGRTLPFSAMGSSQADDGPIDADHFDQNGMWRQPPAPWDITPEKIAVDKEIGQQIQIAMEALPARQRLVLELRDVQGWTSTEVRNVMDVSETNQRVLLHRARSKVRRALDDYLKGQR